MLLQNHLFLVTKCNGGVLSNMKKIKLLSLSLFTLFVVSVVSCGAKRKSSDEYAPQIAESKVTSADAGGFNAFSDVEMATDMAYEQPAAFESNVPLESYVERKLIKNGLVELSVESMEDISVKVERWIKTFGGYVFSSEVYETRGYFTLKVPVERFDSAINSAGGFGKITNQNVNTDDVTDQYYDLQSRIETKKILVNKYSEYLSRAKDVKELLEIERQINNITSELESMQGQLKRLSSLTNYSTINLNFTTPVQAKEEDLVWPDFHNFGKRFGSHVAMFFSYMFKILLYLLVFGVPLAGVCILLYWLLFGKIGILRKLYEKSLQDSDKKDGKK